MSDPEILDRIDDTLEQWDEWDGNSPDAARWAGEPDESEWPDCDHSLFGELLEICASLCEYPPRLCPTCRTEMLDPRERQLQYFRWVQARRRR